MDNKLVREMQHTILQKIYTLLDVEDDSGNDCRKLAELLKMPQGQIRLVWRGRGRGPARPTESVLNWWGTKNNATVQQLREKLVEMPRKDVVDILDEEYGAPLEHRPPNELRGNIQPVDDLPDYDMQISS